MTSQVFRRVQGDLNDTAEVVIDGVVDLASVTEVVARVEYSQRRFNLGETLTATVTDVANRIITVQLGAASGWLSDARPGHWKMDYTFTFNDGKELTWPSGWFDYIRVRPRAKVTTP